MTLLSPFLAFAETYAHGYLRYEVADQSVTITGYAGGEETVTVPAMIGGNPVNTIAAGAFADAQSVKTVYLPDTVTSIEQGAFDVGQKVVYANHANGTAEGSGNASSGDAAEPSQPAPADNSAQTPSSSETTLGMHTDNGSLVTVDDEGNLVLVDPAGIERVLDDSRSYTRKTQSDGTVAIVNDAGDKVTVTDGSKVSFADAEGRQIEVDAANGVTTVTDENGSFGSEEVEISDDASDASAEAVSANSSKKAEEQQEASVQEENSTPLSPIIAGVIAIAIVAAGGIVFWKRRKR